MNIYIEVIRNFSFIILMVVVLTLIVVPIGFLIDKYIKWVFEKFYKGGIK